MTFILLIYILNFLSFIPSPPFFVLFKLGLTLEPKVSCNSLCSIGWPQTHDNPPVSLRLSKVISVTSISSLIFRSYPSQAFFFLSKPQD